MVFTPVALWKFCIALNLHESSQVSSHSVLFRGPLRAGYAVGMRFVCSLNKQLPSSDNKHRKPCASRWREWLFAGRPRSPRASLHEAQVNRNNSVLIPGTVDEGRVPESRAALAFGRMKAVPVRRRA